MKVLIEICLILFMISVSITLIAQTRLNRLQQRINELQIKVNEATQKQIIKIVEER